MQLHSHSETHPIWLFHPLPLFAQGSYRCPGYSSSYLLCGTCACSLHHVLTSSSVILSFSPSLGRTPTRVTNSLALPLPSSNWTRVGRNSTSSLKRYLSWAPQCCSAIPWHFSSLLHSARHHFTPPRLSYKPLPAPSSSQSLLTCLVISPFLLPSLNNLFTTQT